MTRIIWPGVYAASVLASCTALALAALGAPGLFVPVLAVALKFVGMGAVGVVAAARRQRLGPVVLAATALVALDLLAGAAFATGVGQAALARAWIWVSLGPLLVVWLFFLFTFPDGRFAGPVRKRVFVGVALITLLGALAAYAFGSPGLPVWPLAVGAPSPVASVFGAIPLVGLGALYARFRSAAGAERLQIRWVLWGAAADVLTQVGRAALRATGALDFAEAVGVASAPVMPLAIAIALLRHRLWEIDLLLPRAAAFLLLSAGLTAAVAGVGAAAGLLAAGSGLPLGLVIGIVLVVAALTEPARRYLEALFERHFAPGLGGQAALARFMRELERTSAVDELAGRLTESLRRALGASSARLLLAVRAGDNVELRAIGRPGDAAPAAASPLQPDDVALLAAAQPVAASRVPHLAARLSDERAALLLPLVAQGGLVGVVALVGVRQTADPELLTAFGRHAALALRELRLAEELQARLAQIEAQAAALRAAQQRLATAQVAERRRIERDLHDGAQQRLVALAIELARLAEELPDAALRQRAGALQAAAEETLAGLQALARGIYPSLLADRGLAAALAALARQQSVPTMLEVDEALRTSRSPREVEAALYFTAAEAVTNAAKHADARHVAIALRREDDAIALEVRDDGRGFDPGTSTAGMGLRNMRDRADALGGRLVVDAAPGQGTRVRALFPLISAVPVGSPDGPKPLASLQPVGLSRR